MKSSLILCVMLLIPATALATSWPASYTGSYSSNTPLVLGSEVIWDQATQNGDFRCFSYQINGTQTLDSIQGTVSSMREGQDHNHYSQGILMIYDKLNAFQSNNDINTNSNSKCLDKKGNVAGWGNFGTKGRIASVMISKLVSNDDSTYFLHVTDMNYTIKAGHFLVVVYQDGSDLNQGWYDGEVQLTAYFKN